MAEDKDVSSATALNVAVRTFNKTFGLSGLVLTLLLLGTRPRISVRSTVLPTNSKRMEVMYKYRKEKTDVLS